MDNTHKNAQQMLENDDLFKISQHFNGPHWSKIGRKLGLDAEVIRNIELKSTGKDFSSQAEDMLLQWRERFPQNCNLAKFVTALENLQFNKKVLDVLCEFSSEDYFSSSTQALLESCTSKVQFRILLYRYIIWIHEQFKDKENHEEIMVKRAKVLNWMIHNKKATKEEYKCKIKELQTSKQNALKGMSSKIATNEEYEGNQDDFETTENILDEMSTQTATKEEYKSKQEDLETSGENILDGTSTKEEATKVEYKGKQEDLETPKDKNLGVMSTQETATKKEHEGKPKDLETLKKITLDEMRIKEEGKQKDLETAKESISGGMSSKQTVTAEVYKGKQKVSKKTGENMLSVVYVISSLPENAARHSKLSKTEKMIFQMSASAHNETEVPLKKSKGESSKCSLYRIGGRVLQLFPTSRRSYDVTLFESGNFDIPLNVYRRILTESELVPAPAKEYTKKSTKQYMI